MNESNSGPRFVQGILAAAIGGCLGYFAFFWIARQNLYTLIVPPALLGLAGGFAIRGRSQLLAIGCGIAGLALALFTEWKFAPFVADESLLYFLTHLTERKPITLIMLVSGTVISYRLALGLDSTPRDTSAAH